MWLQIKVAIVTGGGGDIGEPQLSITFIYEVLLKIEKLLLFALEK